MHPAAFRLANNERHVGRLVPLLFPVTFRQRHHLTNSTLPPPPAFSWTGLYGGSEDTHGEMQEKAMKLNEHLEKKKKTLEVELRG